MYKITEGIKKTLQTIKPNTKRIAALTRRPSLRKILVKWSNQPNIEQADMLIGISINTSPAIKKSWIYWGVTLVKIPCNGWRLLN